MKVVLAIKLTREGTLDGQPVVSSESSPTTSDYARAYQQSTLRALAACQPYRLPVEYYDQWKYFAPVFMEMPGKPVAGVFDTRTPSICRGC
jgi:hypothetical protein